MKISSYILSVGISCLASCFLLSGCGEQKQIDHERIKTIKVEETAHLDDDDESPVCKVTIDYSYLAVSNDSDVVAQRINETVQGNLLGKKYVRISPETAIDSFKNVYIAEYRKEMNEFYMEDIKNGLPKSNLPSWYNYEFELITHYSLGKDSVINLMAEVYVNTGGAHPNTWSRWMNFDKDDGKLLTHDNVFIPGADKSLSELLLKELIKEMAERLEDSGIKSLSDLQDKGILTSTNMYVSENFLLEKDGISFMYNRYDIAPYVIGDITLYLPYTEIEKYMLR